MRSVIASRTFVSSLGYSATKMPLSSPSSSMSPSTRERTSALSSAPFCGSSRRRFGALRGGAGAGAFAVSRSSTAKRSLAWIGFAT